MDVRSVKSFKSARFGPESEGVFSPKFAGESKKVSDQKDQRNKSKEKKIPALGELVRKTNALIQSRQTEKNGSQSKERKKGSPSPNKVKSRERSVEKTKQNSNEAKRDQMISIDQKDKKQTVPQQNNTGSRDKINNKNSSIEKEKPKLPINIEKVKTSGQMKKKKEEDSFRPADTERLDSDRKDTVKNDKTTLENKAQRDKLDTKQDEIKQEVIKIDKIDVIKKDQMRSIKKDIAKSINKESPEKKQSSSKKLRQSSSKRDQSNSSVKNEIKVSAQLDLSNQTKKNKIEQSDKKDQVKKEDRKVDSARGRQNDSLKKEIAQKQQRNLSVNSSGKMDQDKSENVDSVKSGRSGKVNSAKNEIGTKIQRDKIENSFSKDPFKKDQLQSKSPIKEIPRQEKNVEQKQNTKEKLSTPVKQQDNSASNQKDKMESLQKERITSIKKEIQTKINTTQDASTNKDLRDKSKEPIKLDKQNSNKNEQNKNQNTVKERMSNLAIKDGKLDSGRDKRMNTQDSARNSAKGKDKNERDSSKEKKAQLKEPQIKRDQLEVDKKDIPKKLEISKKESEKKVQSVKGAGPKAVPNISVEVASNSKKQNQSVSNSIVENIGNGLVGNNTTPDGLKIEKSSDEKTKSSDHKGSGEKDKERLDTQNSKNSKKSKKKGKDQEGMSNRSKGSKQREITTKSGNKANYDELVNEDITIDGPDNSKQKMADDDEVTEPSSSSSDSSGSDTSDSDPECKGKKPPPPPPKFFLFRWSDEIMWWVRNTRSLLVEKRISLEKHEPENADQHWKTTVSELSLMFFTFGFVLYIVLNNAENIGKLKQQQVNLVMNSVLNYDISYDLLPIHYFQTIRKYQITNRMECLEHQDLDSCIEYCKLLVETTKYTDINNLWECIDQYAKIPPRYYGVKKCNSLDRNGNVRDKKVCYDDIDINERNKFYDIYDAKLAFCKWQIKNAPYDVWEQCNSKWGVKYDEEDCSYKFTHNTSQTLDDLKKCWVELAHLPLVKARCNNLQEHILLKFDANIAKAMESDHHHMTSEESLDLRYDCFKYMLNQDRDREFCQNYTHTNTEYYNCIIQNNITLIADDILFKYGASSYRGIGYDKTQTQELDKTGLTKDASRYMYELTQLQHLKFTSYEPNQMIINKRANKQIEILKSMQEMLIPYVYFFCMEQQNPFFAYEFIIYYMQIDGAQMMTEECALKFQMQAQEYDKYPMYAQNPHEYMKEFYGDQCQRIEVDDDKLYQCMLRNRFASNINLVDIPSNTTAAVQAYRRYCDNTFDHVTQATDWFICMLMTGNEKYNQGQCIYQTFVQVPRPGEVGAFIFPLTHKYRCALQNLLVIDDEVKKCQEWGEKYNVQEKCLGQYERTNYLGFIPNFGDNLIEYWYGSVGTRIIPTPPFIADSNITIQEIQDYICDKRILFEFSSYPFIMINQTGDYPVNQTFYRFDCNAFLFEQKDRYDKILVHHYFTNETLKPFDVYNPIPPTLDIEKQNGTMPLLFNRTETNKQYINITYMPDLDNIPVIKQEMYTKPVKPEDLLQLEAKLDKLNGGNGTVEKKKSVIIENQEEYDAFTKHPDTIKIFTADQIEVGERTFPPIFVNCDPEQQKFIGQVIKKVIMGFTVETGDLVLKKINIEKILALVESIKTIDIKYNLKNNILIDFRIGFTESQAKLTYYTMGDIFAELGGLSASVKLVVGSTTALLVLSYVFDLQQMIKRKAAHKFRILTIEKYQKTLPQIKKIIKTIPEDHPDYKEFMEDKATIKIITDTPLNTIKRSAQVYDLLRYLISKLLGKLGKGFLCLVFLWADGSQKRL